MPNQPNSPPPANSAHPHTARRDKPQKKRKETRRAYNIRDEASAHPQGKEQSPQKPVS